MNSVYFIIILCLVEIFGDFSLQKYVQTDSNIYLIFGIIFYIGVVYFLIESLKTANILFVNAMWDGLSALFESLFAFFILGERFQHYHQYIGLLMIIVGLFIVRYKNEPIVNKLSK